EAKPHALLFGGLDAEVSYLDPVTGEALTAFAKGDKVRVKVTATLSEDGYRFDVGTIVSINGVMQAVNSYQDESNAVFSFAYTVPADQYAITSASMDLAFPEVGDEMPSPVDVTGVPESARFGVFTLQIVPSDARVKEDTPYTAAFWLKADKDYYFADDAVFRINGETVTAKLEQKNTVAVLNCVFPAQKLNPYPVETLNVLELDAPVAGGAPDTEYRVEGTPHTPEGDLRVEYLDAATGEAKASFARLDKVVVKVTVVRRNPKYVYADDLTALWNGMEAKAVFTDEAKKYAEFRFNWIVGADGREILYVPLTMAVPAVGDDRPTGPDCITVPENSLYFVPTCLISPYDKQIREGTEYTAQITVKAMGDHHFADDTVFAVNGKAVGDVSLGTEKDYAGLTFVFPEKATPSDATPTDATPSDATPSDATPQEILSVAMEMKFPAAGEDRPAGSDCITVAPGAHSFISAFSVSPFDAQIQEGKEYTVSVTVAAEKPYHFTDRTVFTMNGSRVEVKRNTDNTGASFTVVFPEKSVPSGVKLGDVDGDGEITSGDARLCLRRSVSLQAYEVGSREYIACDVDKKDGVTSADARLILRASVSLEDPSKW
ncbi:MAG: hypothetical protein IJK98_03210, partial [Clostridia bacterium]|nr:hypothetical protein [Clostridia bacterium]